MENTGGTHIEILTAKCLGIKWNGLRQNGRMAMKIEALRGWSLQSFQRPVAYDFYLPIKSMCFRESPQNHAGTHTEKQRFRNK